MIKINLNRIEGDAGFEATDANDHIVRLDTSPETGGVNFGIRPMQGLLMSLGACSGIDIVSILKKQRQEIKAFSIEIEGEREKGKEPSLWTNIYITFTLTGPDEDKAKRACDLSISKYCSVAETLRRAGATINWSLIIKN